MENQVLIKHPKNWGLEERLIGNLAKKFLIDFGYKNNVELSIIFVGQNRAKKLNQNYRHKDYVPQVLGFPMSKMADADGIIRLGDVVICTQKLKYEAVFQKKAVSEILTEWVKHGIENLLK
jgi:probable rRNA maturation factor